MNRINIIPKKRNNRFILLAILLVILSIESIWVFNPQMLGITGFATYEEISTLTLNKMYYESSEEILDINSQIKFLSIDASLTGEGEAVIWLEHDNNRILIARLQADSSPENNEGNLITGLVTDDIIDEIKQDEITQNEIEVNTTETTTEPIIESNTTETKTEKQTQTNTTETKTEPIIESNTTEENTTQPVIEEETTTEENVTIEEEPIIEPTIESNTTETKTEKQTQTNTTETITEEETQTNTTETITEEEIQTSFTNECIDSCIMEGVPPYKLIIELSNATLYIENINYQITYEPIIQVETIPDITIDANNNSSTLNLSEYFNSTKELSYDINTIETQALDISINEELLQIYIQNTSISESIEAYIYATDGENTITSNIFMISSIGEIIDVSNITIETTQYPARINERVKWIKNIKSIEQELELNISLPIEAENITVTKRTKENTISKEDVVKETYSKEKIDINEEEKLDEQKKQKNNGAIRIETQEESEGPGELRESEGPKYPIDSLESFIPLEINDTIENVEIEYYTEAPIATETSISENVKEVVISSETHYTSVLSYADLPSEISSDKWIKLTWIINNTENTTNLNLTLEELEKINTSGFIEKDIPFKSYDTNDNGLLDHIEWIAPHLSQQKFIIIVITKADLLDDNRTFIEPIYEYVKEQDDIWFNVTENNYVRVTFEKELTSINDITIYARTQTPNTTIKVYEEGQNMSIAEFTNLTEEKYYKIYLTNLNTSRDTFDLKIIGGSVEIDHIIDPPYETENAKTGMVMYSKGDAKHTIAYRFWNKTDFESEINISMPELYGSQVQWVLARASTTRDQIGIAVLDDDGDILLNVYNTTGDSWGTWLDVANIGRTNDAYRGFGMGVEQDSGDFMVVYENITTANRLVHYRTWDGSSWSSEGTITLNSNVANEQQVIIRLENAPIGDEILMATAGGNDDLSVARWNGTAWANVTTVTLVAAAVDEERFSIAYERNSNDAMIAWGNSTSALYMILDNTTKTWSTATEIANRGASVNQITLCADPNSDYIGAAIGPDSLSDLIFMIWNGTTWITGQPTEETGIEDVSVVNAYCTWKTNDSIALFTFVDANGLQIEYLTYNKTGNNWTCPENGQTVTSLENAEGANGPCNTGNIMSDDIEVLRSARDPDSNDILLWGMDIDFTLETFIFNGTHVTQPPTTLLESTTGWLATVEPVWFTYYKHPEAAASSGAIFYGEFTNGTQQLKYRNFESGDYGEEKTAPDLGPGAAVQYVLLRSSTQRDQTAAAIMDDDGDMFLNVYDYGSGLWNGWTFISEIGITNDIYRGFGMEVEQESGDFLVVYERTIQNMAGNRLVYYRIWNGTEWSAEGTLTLNSNVAAEGQTIIRLENAPTGDEILMASAGTNEDISVARWNGTEWANVTTVTLVAAAVEEERFSIAYERNSNDAMIAWGNSTSALYMILDNTTKTWSTATEIANRGASVNQIKLCADPNSDYIGAAIGPDSLSDLIFMIWNGTTWITGEPTEETGIEDVSVVNAYCTWTTNSNVSLFTFVDANGLQIEYLTYNKTGNDWTCPENGQTVTSLENLEGANGPCNTGNIMSDDIEVLRSARDPDNNNIMLWGNDLAEDIEMFIFNGTYITQSTTALLETVTTTSSTVEPVWFTYSKYNGAESESDSAYPQFSLFNDNNATLYGSGTGMFNVTVINTNGTVLLEIDGTNITATNISANIYIATYEFSANGTYTYRWHSWGNGTSNNYNRSEDRTYLVYDLALNQQPTITSIKSIGSVDPVENSQKIININFTVNDADGNNTINISSANIIVNYSTTKRQSTSCTGIAINATAQNISCNVTMQYYDPYGIWNVNISIKDDNNEYVENSTTTFTYNELSAIQINTNNIDIGTVNIEQQNVGLNPIIINNTGNSIFVNMSIFAVDLINNTDIISTSNFVVNVTDSIFGQSLINNTYINITNSGLNRNNDTTNRNVTLYIYLDVPSAPLIAGYYTSISEWIIVANK